METQSGLNFERITQAIRFIQSNFRQQPDLDEIAAAVNLSPHHFQRMFSDWAGVSPKKFLQFTTLEYAKGMLKEKQATLFDAAFETGLSGTGRLHDLFVSIEGMTPGEYKNGGDSLTINYSFAETPFGDVLVASTTKGICFMAFADDQTTAFSSLRKKFPNAGYHQKIDGFQQEALQIFRHDWTAISKVKLHLKGTDFQLKVWEALLNIPFGGLKTYGQLATQIGSSQASRAVGTAIGSNPVAFLIPCHRVIQSSGVFGGYYWGKERKTAIIGWEASRL